MTDRLDLANAFEGAGIERRAAERLADEIFAAIRENVATKADIEAVRSEIREAELRLRAEIEKVRTKVERVRADVHGWLIAQAFAIIGAVAAIVALATALGRLIH